MAGFVLAVSACAPYAPPAGGVFVSGDVKDVLAGQCTADRYQRYRARDFVAALGCATTQSEASAGELLALYGRALIRTTDAAAGYPTVESDEVIGSPFVMGLAVGRSPRGRDCLVSRPVRLAALLADKVGSGATILLARANRLEATALRKAPMYGQPIQGEAFREQYFHPTIVQRDRWVLLFAIAVAPRGPASRPGRLAMPDAVVADQLLERGFYVNLADGAASRELKYHAHAWVLARRPDGATLAEMAHTAVVDQVVHVLGQSELSVERMTVFPLGEPSRPPAPVAVRHGRGGRENR